MRFPSIFSRREPETIVDVAVTPFAVAGPLPRNIFEIANIISDGARFAMNLSVGDTFAGIEYEALARYPNDTEAACAFARGVHRFLPLMHVNPDTTVIELIASPR